MCDFQLSRERGAAEESEVTEGSKYADKKPIVYYGSSITQCGCSSRPGVAYQAIIARALNQDYLRTVLDRNAICYTRSWRNSL